MGEVRKKSIQKYTEGRLNQEEKGEEKTKVTLSRYDMNIENRGLGTTQQRQWGEEEETKYRSIIQSNGEGDTNGENKKV